MSEKIVKNEWKIVKINNRKFYNRKEFLKFILKSQNLTLIDKFIVRIDVNSKGAKYYTDFNNENEFLEWFDTLDDNKKCCYEEYNEGQRIKIFFDIEWNYDIIKNENITLNHTNEFIDDIKNCLCNELKIKEINHEDFILLSSSNKEKYSYHIIWNEYYFDNYINMKEFARSIKSKLNEKYNYINLDIETSIIDLSVYKTSQSFRLVNNHKMGSNRILKISNGNKEFTKSLLTRGFNENIKKLPFECQTEKKHNKNRKTKKSEDKQQKKNDTNKEIIDKYCPFSYEEVEKIVMSLNKKRSIEYNKWLYVIFAVNSLGDEYKKIAHNFSKQCKEKYNKEQLNYLLDNSHTSGYTYKSLLYWLKKDLGYKEYKNFLIENKIRLYERNENIDEYKKYIWDKEYGFSNIISEELCNNVKIVDNEGNGYVWDDTKKLWIKYSPSRIRYFMIPYLKKILKIINEDYEIEEGNKDILDKWNKYYKSLKSKIIDIHFVKNIFEYAKNNSKLYNPEFLMKINMKIDVLPIQGGMLVKLKHFKIRERKQKDLFSFECPVNWKENYDKEFIEEEFLGKMFCHDKDIIQYVRRILGYSFTGRNNEKMLFNIYGKKNNNKSGVDTAIRNILGNFATVLPKEIFFQNYIAKSSHTSYLDTIKNGERYGSFCEIEDDDKCKIFNTGLIKNITGKDGINGKSCGAKERYTINPNTILFIYTNPKLKLNISDDALINRFFVINAEGTFTTNPEEVDDKKHIYLADINFGEKMKDYYDDFFMWCCKGAYFWYKKSLRVDIPDKLLFCKNDYLENMSNVKEFIDECLIKIDILPKKYYISANNLYKLYIEYAKKDQEPTYKDTFKYYLGNPVKNSSMLYYGYATKDIIKNYIVKLVKKFEINEKILELKDYGNIINNYKKKKRYNNLQVLYKNNNIKDKILDEIVECYNYI